MRHLPLFLILGFSPFLQAQEQAISPTEELRVIVNEWVEAMRQIQQEENDWTRDQEVLTNYREGLGKEITDLKEKIAEAKTRKEGADSESLKQSAERDRFLTARDGMAKSVRSLEEKMAAKLPLIPAPLRAEPKVSQSIEDLERALSLPEDKRDSDVSKRLQNLINLTTEIEKFQQTVVLRQEIHNVSGGREVNLEVLYFGLSAAYAVSKDGSLALVGTPDAKDGWKFTERNDLAGTIRDLIDSTNGDRDPSFISLPISQ